MNAAAWPRGWAGTLLAPLGLLYAAAATLRVRLYRRGLLRSVRPPRPTLSVGNLAAGGTGKTPLLFACVAWLERHGASVGVLSRGYGGDEGRMLERRHPRARLAENPDRIAGLRALMEAQPPPDVLLLDDGFQHLRLQRDLDVVLLDATRPFGPCLPAGLFREAPRALRRADLVVLSRADLVEEETRREIWARVHAARGGNAKLPEIEGGVAVRELRHVAGGETRPAAELRGMRARLAAAIGNPESFRRLCADAGATVLEATWRRDHADLGAELPALCRALGEGERVLVTEKDAVKLGADCPESVWEVRVDWRFTRGADHFEDALMRLHLPVRAARIEPLWGAHDPDGRHVQG